MTSAQLRATGLDREGIRRRANGGRLHRGMLPQHQGPIEVTVPTDVG